MLASARIPMTEVRAELAGSVLKTQAQVGDEVAQEHELLTLESMKMEIPVIAPAAGVVAEVHISESQPVQEGDLLITIRVGPS